jgi:hypothetical protein
MTLRSQYVWSRSYLLNRFERGAASAAAALVFVNGRSDLLPVTLVHSEMNSFCEMTHNPA